MISRREWIIGAFATAHAWAEQSQGLKRMTRALASTSPELIETHIHLFAGDPRFPYNSASYPPKPEPVEAYVKFAQVAHIEHAGVVTPNLTRTITATWSIALRTNRRPV